MLTPFNQVLSRCLAPFSKKSPSPFFLELLFLVSRQLREGLLLFLASLSLLGALRKNSGDECPRERKIPAMSYTYKTDQINQRVNY